MKNNSLKLTPEFIRKTAELYRDMESAYDRIAGELEFSCSGCTDNCCDSFFMHHTYTEWAYLWHGLNSLDSEKQQEIITRATHYVTGTEAALTKREMPVIMCPLNAEGLCGLYSHRMMICRLHGVPSAFMKPDGKRFNSPGCFRYQEISETKTSPAVLDRTGFFQRLINLEIELLSNKKNNVPKVKLTIAQMIVMGPPEIF